MVVYFQDAFLVFDTVFTPLLAYTRVENNVLASIYKDSQPLSVPLISLIYEYVLIDFFPARWFSVRSIQKRVCTRICSISASQYQVQK